MDAHPPSPRAPLVTVGIPTYNRPDGLRRTLECIRGQTYPNLEILISDNCSTTPETRAVALAHQQADPRVKYHRQDANIGLEANFKYLLAQARGEYYFWAADDDEWTPDFVAVCVAKIGDAGSVMTGMRNAIRSRGLLRWKPPLDLSPERGAFANAVAFLNNAQPSLFYGIHRTAELRRFLQERMYDYYDYFFILRQILTVGFKTAPDVCFNVGIESDAPIFKPARPRTTAVYEYKPFLRDALRATLGARSLGLFQKLRLAYLLSYVAVNEFAHFERELRPFHTRLANLTKRALRLVRPLFRVPLPAPPPTMVLPTDPADLCTMFVPAAKLTDPVALRAEIADAQREVRAKLDVLRNLSAESGGRFPPPGPDDSSAPLLAAAPPGADPGALRAQLGGLLMQLEEKEAVIQRRLPRGHPSKRAA
ncbi:MAG: glycosyltransferase family 2 protein [Planctomycetes bacterium]|nr:glycosyltransferase family 2 protein [Planctomycetota bacterium]